MISAINSFKFKHMSLMALMAIVLLSTVLLCASSFAQTEPTTPRSTVEDIIPRIESKPTDDVFKTLPLFGADVFSGAQISNVVNPQLPIPAGYIFGPGDKLRVKYWSPVIPEVTHEVVVGRNGMVSIPDVGDISITGLTMDGVQTRIGGRLKEIIKQPGFSIDLIEPRMLTVLVTGAAKRPGMYTVSALCDMFDIACACGGPTDQGSMRRIELKRADKTVAVLDAYKVIAGGNRSQASAQIQDQDVLFFPTAGPHVALQGEVVRPAIYETIEGMTVADLLDLAGGYKGSAYTKLLRIERFEDGRRVERTLDASAIASNRSHPDNLTLKDGDKLFLENIGDKVYERVSIRGPVSFPGDYAISRTPTIKALVNEAKLRKGAYAERADILRILDDGTPVIVPVQLQAILDGSADDIQLQDTDEVIIYSTDEKSLTPIVTIEGAVKHPASFRMAENMKVSDLIFASGGLLRDAAPDAAHIYRRTGPNDFRVIRVSPTAALNHSTSDDIILQDEDKLVIYRQKDVDYRNDKVSIMGEVQRPGEYKAYDGLTLYDLLLQAGGPIDTAAGTIEVSIPLSGPDKKASVATFTLSEVMNGAHKNDMVAPGTLVSVPKRGDRIPKPWSVELKGQFVQPGTYALLYEGETLGSLLKRAGGFQENADPFGISLTRKREQMLSLATSEQIKMVLDTMDQLLPPIKDTPNASGTGVDIIDMGTMQSPVGGLTGTGTDSKVILVSPRRLATMPTGKRIAFDLEDRNSYIERIGNVRLVDGDIVEVPRKSEVVQVLGAVQSPGPVFYQASLSPKDYLQRAGGGAPDSDMDRAVVIKVSGAVHPFNKVKTIDPGDVIVVASKYRVIQPPRKKTLDEILFQILGAALIVNSFD